jgi:hypothetical protein
MLRIVAKPDKHFSEWGKIFLLRPHLSLSVLVHGLQQVFRT